MTPGRILVHPVSLAAAATYLLNDHVLKAAMPGVLSGKLSDVAGMVVLPVTMVALCELLLRRELGRPSLVAAIGVTMVGFTAVEVWPVAEAAWCWTWGALQWPAHAAMAWWEGAPPPALRPVLAWSDPTDLLTCPAGLLALGVRGPPRAEAPPRHAGRS